MASAHQVSKEQGETPTDAPRHLVIACHPVQRPDDVGGKTLRFWEIHAGGRQIASTARKAAHVTSSVVAAPTRPRTTSEPVP